MSKHDIEGFREELRELLAKYDVSLVAHYDGDSHGIYNERIEVCDTWHHNTLHAFDDMFLDKNNV